MTKKEKEIELRNNIVDGLRLTLLLVLILFSFVCTFSTPADELDASAWLVVLALSKGIGVGGFWLAWRLFKRWAQED